MKSLPATVTPTSGSRERMMFRHFAVSSMAMMGLLTMAVEPAAAGATTGTWKYWNPSLAQAAPSGWRPYAGRSYDHRGYHEHHGGYTGYSRPPHGHAYGYNHHGW